jgi:hypothetical protein
MAFYLMTGRIDPAASPVCRERRSPDSPGVITSRFRRRRRRYGQVRGRRSAERPDGTLEMGLRGLRRPALGTSVRHHRAGTFAVCAVNSAGNMRAASGDPQNNLSSWTPALGLTAKPGSAATIAPIGTDASLFAVDTHGAARRLTCAVSAGSSWGQPGLIVQPPQPAGPQHGLLCHRPINHRPLPPPPARRQPFTRFPVHARLHHPA